MSKSLNKVQLIGRLGADPQMRYTTSGVAVTSFSLATNRQWTGKDGVQHDDTDWHNIVAWDKLGQVCSEHLTRGRLVFIEGRLQSRSWEQDGQTRYKTEIVASDMLILDTKGQQSTLDEVGASEERRDERPVAEPQERHRIEEPRKPVQAATQRATGRIAVIEPEDDPDDLPF